MRRSVYLAWAMSDNVIRHNKTFCQVDRYLLTREIPVNEKGSVVEYDDLECSILLCSGILFDCKACIVGVTLYHRIRSGRCQKWERAYMSGVWPCCCGRTY